MSAITFSEVMKASSVNVTMNGVSLTGAWENLTYTLSTELEYDTEYIVTVNGEDRGRERPDHVPMVLRDRGW